MKDINKRHIIAFDDLNDIPVVYIDGVEIEHKTKVYVNWTTDKDEVGNREFDINWYNDGVIQNWVGRITRPHTMLRIARHETIML